MVGPLGFQKQLLKFPAQGMETDDDPLLEPQSLLTTQASAERYRAIADSTFDLICEVDAEAQFVYLSSSFGATLGLETAQLVGTSLFERVHVEDRAHLIAEYTAALTATRVGRAEHRFRHPNGEWRWFESVLRGVGTGEERRVVIVSREITARQRHQVELETLIALAKSVHSQSDLPSIAREIWAHLHSLLPITALMLVWPCDENAGPNEPSRTLQIVGQTREERASQTIDHKFHPECPLWKALARSEVWLDNVWDGGLCGLDFLIRSFVAVPLAVDVDERGVLFFAAERPFVWTEEHVRLCALVGEQALVAVRGVRLLEQAHAAQERYRTLVNDVDAIVWEADGAMMRLTFVSQQIEEWFGFPREKWLSDAEFWLSVVHPDDRASVVAEMRQKFRSRAPWQIEFRASSAEGKQLWLRMLITSEFEDGAVTKMRGLTLDVTERRQHLDDIREANAVLAATQEASADGICLVDETGQVVSLNGRFAEMWHISSALLEELRDKRQLMACVLAQMSVPEEFLER
jgi:PAS domain S-box-containing protein